MFSDDSHSKRDFTVESVTLPNSPGTVLLDNTVATLSARELAGALLALVRDYDAFTPSAREATVVFVKDEVELQFAHKDLRVQFYRGGPVTWPTVQDRLHDLPAGTEWLVIAMGALTSRAKAEIDDANCHGGAHYIEIGRNVRWKV